MIQARDIATLGGKAPQVVPIVGAEADTLAWMALNIFLKDADYYHADGCLEVQEEGGSSVSGCIHAHLAPIGVDLIADWYAAREDCGGDGYCTPREYLTEVKAATAFLEKDGRRLVLTAERQKELDDLAREFAADEVDKLEAA